MESWVRGGLSYKCIESLEGGRLPLEMYGELGKGTTATRNV